MSDELMAEIDEILSAELPDGPPADADTLAEERKREMVKMLQQAAEELGKSPTIHEFNSLDFDVSASAIKHVFGTWNDAKRAADLETFERGATTPIDESFFEAIDSEEKAYWLGTLIARSSIQSDSSKTYHHLSLGRTDRKAYFITQFAKAVKSEYPIRTYPNDKSSNDQHQLQISNPLFVQNLIDAGYPAPEEALGSFPSIQSALRPAFVRGYLESSGYFSTSGWAVKTENLERAETFQGWFEDFGAKRPTRSEQADGQQVVRVSNVFDIKAVFETCWPEQTRTAPSFEPYPQKILDYLQSEYPYPENVPYLDG